MRVPRARRQGRERKPQTQPDCAAVLRPGADPLDRVPDGFEKKGGAPALVHRTGAAELRVGSVRCAVPDGIHVTHAQYHVFVRRADGWWRTARPIYELNINDKYCSGAQYLHWNDKPARTIVGLALQSVCSACTKAAEHTSLAELMLRVELGGDKPAVFPLLAVGVRDRLEPIAELAADAPECKASRSAMSLQERWPSDDEVVLTGAAGPSVSTLETMTLPQVVGGGKIAPGRYRFTR